MSVAGPPQDANSGHPFDAAVALQPLAEGVWQGCTSPAYGNMIGPYGGITAAQMLNAVLLHPHRLGDPVAFTVNFAAALADGLFLVHPRAVRTNRSTQHWSLDLRQGGHIVATGTAVTALRRDTWGAAEAAMPQAPRPGDTPRTVRRGVEWLQRYDMRYLEGGLPHQWDGADTGRSLSRLWVRDEPARPLDFASLAAVADVFFPRMWLRRATPGPVGTVSMTVYFHADSQQVAATGAGWLMAQAQGHGFGKGYHDHAGLLWNEAGDLLATTHQVVYYKE